MNLTFSQCKELRDLLGSDWREAAEEMASDNPDAYVGNFRIVHSDDIDEIQREELLSDLYMLGCFNAWFLADHLPISQDAIEKMQACECFEALGEIARDYIDSIQRAYAGIDGYGHHFAHYDHEEHEIGDYYLFRTD